MREKIVPMTRDGRARVEREIEELRLRRREIAERIQSSRELSTAQNNAEYDDAKKDLELNENRIRMLEQQLERSVLIDEEQAHHASNVLVGSTVIVSVNNKQQEYTIVGSTEADPPAGRISNESPVGSALLGKRVGDEVMVMAPRGLVKMTITEIK